MSAVSSRESKLFLDHDVLRKRPVNRSNEPRGFLPLYLCFRVITLVDPVLARSCVRWHRFSVRLQIAWICPRLNGCRVDVDVDGSTGRFRN